MKHVLTKKPNHVLQNTFGVLVGVGCSGGYTINVINM